MDDTYEHINHAVGYCPSSVPGKGCPEMFYEEFSEGCRCGNGLVETNCLQNCSCLKKVNCGYDENQKLCFPVSKYPIFECNAKCTCSMWCKNNIVQGGPLPHLLVKRVSEAKGLGLFCGKDIAKGTFVCTYSGEIISYEEGQKRSRYQQKRKMPNYIIFVKETFDSGSSVTVIDPTVIGNIGRYCNHSCDPNLVMIPVRIENMVPHLALFASEDIPKETELTFDYSGKASTGGLLLPDSNEPSFDEMLSYEERVKLVKCLCGSEAKCHKFLPYQK